MIDLHCHILPGMDDGAQCIEESLEMARIAVADGITAMVATAHCMDPRAVHSAPDEVRGAADELAAALKREGIPLSLFCAHEVMITEDLSEELRAGRLLTIAERGTHLLVELPCLMAPQCAEHVLFEVMAQGVTPVLAHPEKNLEVQHDISLIERIVEREYLIQMDADSLDGRAPREMQRTAVRLLGEGLAHIVASDGHWRERRPPRMSAARDRVRALIGEDAAEAMTAEAPGKIVGLRGG